MADASKAGTNPMRCQVCRSISTPLDPWTDASTYVCFWCSPGFMVTDKAAETPVKDRSSTAAAKAVRNVIFATGRR